uniref:Uncharacterized protein n=1 Tax=Schistosoma curassoni TaxID=6186 RepID=A0A183K9E5_9TREM
MSKPFGHCFIAISCDIGMRTGRRSRCTMSRRNRRITNLSRWNGQSVLHDE